jgi:hypothetical protein
MSYFLDIVTAAPIVEERRVRRQAGDLPRLQLHARFHDLSWRVLRPKLERAPFAQLATK